MGGFFCLRHSSERSRCRKNKKREKLTNTLVRWRCRRAEGEKLGSEREREKEKKKIDVNVRVNIHSFCSRFSFLVRRSRSHTHTSPLLSQPNSTRHVCTLIDVLVYCTITTTRQQPQKINRKEKK